MKIYLVGGAVRDTLLGLPVQERDWVVVGATPEDMLAQGFMKVGKSFPVFLHPKTKEEYALARTEKKVGEGYYGFECDFSPTVTLEEDLERRDLTMNAMAVDYHHLDNIREHIIDPFNGQADLKHKILRHVSGAFRDDPVRLLRVARFLSRFESMGFKIAPETLSLMQEIVAMGEIEALVPERVWQELERAFTQASPIAFVQVLKQTGALKILFPEVYRLYGVPQRAEYHPEVDTGIHTEMVLEKITTFSQNPLLRFCAWVHDLGKGLTPPDEWPSHKGHEERGVPLIKNVCERFKAPASYKELGVIVSRYHLHCHRIFELRADTVLKILTEMDAFRRPDRFKDFLLICQADAQGRLGLEDKPYPQRQYFLELFEVANTVNIKEIISQNQPMPQGEALKNLIIQARIQALKNYQAQYKIINNK